MMEWPWKRDGKSAGSPPDGQEGLVNAALNAERSRNGEVGMDGSVSGDASGGHWHQTSLLEVLVEDMGNIQAQMREDLKSRQLNEMKRSTQLYEELGALTAHGDECFQTLRSQLAHLQSEVSEALQRGFQVDALHRRFDLDLDEIEKAPSQPIPSVGAEEPTPLISASCLGGSERGTDLQVPKNLSRDNLEKSGNPIAVDRVGSSSSSAVCEFSDRPLSPVATFTDEVDLDGPASIMPHIVLDAPASIMPHATVAEGQNLAILDASLLRGLLTEHQSAVLEAMKNHTDAFEKKDSMPRGDKGRSKFKHKATFDFADTETESLVQMGSESAALEALANGGRTSFCSQSLVGECTAVLAASKSLRDEVECKESAGGIHRESCVNDILHLGDENQPAKKFGMMRSMVSDLNEAKDLTTEKYNVEDLYSKTGIFQSIARAELFVSGSFFVILLNAVYIGVETDLNDQLTLYASDWSFIIIDNVFCVLFFGELLIRFGAFRYKTDCLRDQWFRIDLFMVTLMILETWVLAPLQKLMTENEVTLPIELFRLFRLMRLSRLSRLMKNVPELVTMCKGLLQGARACCASIFMIFILVYIFGIALHSVMKDEDEMNARLARENGVQFKRLGDCMWILLVDGTFLLDGTGEILTKLIFSRSLNLILSSCLMLICLFLSAMVVCNMLIGVLCELVAQVARVRRDEEAISLLKDTMLVHLKQFDDGDGMISKDEFDEVMSRADSRKLLETLNVDRVFMLALQKMLYTKTSTSIPIRGIMELMLTCRADTPATVHTIANSLSYLTYRLDELDRHFATSLNQTRRNIKKSIFEVAESY